jgi:hypothetical protein
VYILKPPLAVDDADALALSLLTGVTSRENVSRRMFVTALGLDTAVEVLDVLGALSLDPEPPSDLAFVMDQLPVGD